MNPNLYILSETCGVAYNPGANKNIQKPVEGLYLTFANQPPVLQRSGRR
jgi:hypothetical protein